MNTNVERTVQKVFDKPISRIIDNQLDIKLRQITQEELDVVLTKFRSRKAAGLDEIPPEIWKTRKFDDLLLRYCITVYNQNTIHRWTKCCILPFPKKVVLGCTLFLGITHFFPHNELVYLPYIAVASDTQGRLEGEFFCLSSFSLEKSKFFIVKNCYCYCFEKKYCYLLDPLKLVCYCF